MPDFRYNDFDYKKSIFTTCAHRLADKLLFFEKLYDKMNLRIVYNMDKY